MSTAGCACLETAEHLEYVVLRVGRQSVSTRVNGYAGPSRYAVIESHVGGLGLVVLHIPEAVWWYFPAESLAEYHLSECRAVRWKRSGWDTQHTRSCCHEGEWKVHGKNRQKRRSNLVI